MRDYEAKEQETTSHISYKDYKRMLKKNPKKQSLTLFLGAFCVLLLIFLAMAKMMSPDVDITLGNDEANIMDETMPRGEIDNRLRDLQFEDEYPFRDESSSSEIEDGEMVVIPKTTRQEADENKLPEEIYGQDAVKDVVGTDSQAAPSLQQKVHEKEQTVQSKPQEPATAPAPVYFETTAPSIVARVIVGWYPTIEQADVAKGILQDAGLGVTPFVRRINNGYTLQVGTFGSKEKAMSLAQTLLTQNFPAQVVIESGQ